MRNIIFLVIVIVTVAIAVSCSVSNQTDKKEQENHVSEKQVTGSEEQPKIFTKVIERDNDDILKKLNSLEENISGQISGINVNVNNKEVLSQIDVMKQIYANGMSELIKEQKAAEDKYKNFVNQIMAAIAASMAAIVLILVLVYRYLKKFIADSMITNSYKSDVTDTVPEPKTEDGEENPVVTTVNEAAKSLNSKIAEAAYLFDPEKAVKLDPVQKNTLADINAESDFLTKAGYEITSKQQYLKAVEKINDKNYSDASQILYTITNDDENFSLAYFMNGYIAYVTRKYEEAQTALAKACELEPENSAYLISYGNACLKEKKYDDAAAALKKAAEIKPDDAATWNNLAHAYIVSKKTKEAVEAFQKAAEIKPDFHEALHNLGLALGKLKQYEEALEAFEKAIGVKGDKHESMYNAACVNAILGKREGALSNLKKAIELQPDYAAKAKKDSDLKSFKDDEEFKEITK